MEFAIIKKIATKRPSSSLILHPSSFALPFLFALAVLFGGCSPNSRNEVVIYCSVDQMHAEPILKEFEKQTGIRVKAVYDSEAVKSVGLVNRLRAESKNPQADVFWNNEMVRTYQLFRQNIVGLPQLFAARARVLVYNTNLVRAEDAPRSIFDLTNAVWRGKVAMAYPLFGTTATHAAALFAALGREKTSSYYRSLIANDVRVYEGNSVVCEQVAQGYSLVGITDTDDFWERKTKGLPIEIVYPDQRSPTTSPPFGCCIIPNSFALVINGPNAQNAKKLFNYLQAAEVEEKLAFGPSRQIPLLRDSLPVPTGVKRLSELTGMQVDFDRIADALPVATAELEKLYAR